MRDAMSRRTSPHPGTGTARSSTMARVTGIAAPVRRAAPALHLLRLDAGVL